MKRELPKMLPLVIASIGLVLPVHSPAQSSNECFSIMLVVNGKPFRSPPALTVILPDKRGKMALDPKQMFEIDPEPDGRFCLPAQAANQPRFAVTFLLSGERFLLPDRPKKELLDADWTVSFKTTERVCDLTISKNGKTTESMSVAPCIIDAD
jgi:hypothetical protein